MIVVVGGQTSQKINNYEGLSTDDKDGLLANLDKEYIGSTFVEIDTSKAYKLNLDGSTLKWFEDLTGGSMSNYYTKLESDELFVKKYIGTENLANRIYSMTGGVTVANETTEKSLLDGGIGTKTIPANSLKVGDIIRIEFTNTLSSSTSQQSYVRIKLGGVLIKESLATLPNNLSNNLFEGSADILILSLGTSGTCKILGMSVVQQSNLAALIRDLNNTSLTQINTTIDLNVDLTYKFVTANASNICTSHRALIYLI